MPSDAAAAALSYEEPGIVTILVLSSFLLLENLVNHVLNRLLFCGVIGQIAIGIAWGTPGGNWLSAGVQESVVQLGYVGLILLVYEGGLSTDLKTLKSHLALSSIVALLGVSTPIALSFTLMRFMDITPLQAFAAGASLCSTSLGTTFTILSTSGLGQSRLGVVLSSAAMMDDVVGLVMSEIISKLGGEFSWVTIVRPALVSVAFAIVVPLVCAWFVTTMAKMLARRFKDGTVKRMMETEGATLTFHTAVLLALVTGASYAGASNLFAAYLAGALVTWWDGGGQDLKEKAVAEGSGGESSSRQARKSTQSDSPTTERSAGHDNTMVAASTSTPNGGVCGNEKDETSGERELEQENITAADECRLGPTERETSKTGEHTGKASSPDNLRGTKIFERYYSEVVEVILKPFFFASIGFSIPISRMFSARVVWRGIVYSILMAVGKLVCGICMVRFQTPSLPSLRALLSSSSLSRIPQPCWPWPVTEQRVVPRSNLRTATGNTPRGTMTEGSSGSCASQGGTPSTRRPPASIPKPTSLYPAAMLGSAMVARGEIGFLISSIAESDGIFGRPNNGQSSELFLVTTWAIFLCTLFGPMFVGTLVRRVRRLQDEERSRQSGREDPLGIWGVTPRAERAEGS